MNPPKQPYIIDTSLISPLGLTTNENFTALTQSASGIRLLDDTYFFSKPILGSVIDHSIIDGFKQRLQTKNRFDTLLMACAFDMLQKKEVDYTSHHTLIILSTTKGNIELLATEHESEQIDLNYSASLLQQCFRNPNQVMIVSNACISGISAAIVASRYIQAGLYKHVLVIGCDVVSRFVLSGFNSFLAISKNGCKPFDIDRDGVVLGEACGAILLSSEHTSEIVVAGGGITNDANHISGPSKTGEELAYCIQQLLQQSSVSQDEISFISAHGTATQYNDEMESKAIALAGLNHVPLFSLKAQYGHTLGASGVIECIISVECLKRNILLPSVGFKTKGVSGDVTISQQILEKELRYAVKTTSGFGGCNAALLLKKVH
ncbi:MAG: beta-ketoacyl synthase [Bacteroidetes bacterium]|nr:beta-ketoacyl synthase [Bacteroidota bacterium]